MAGGDDDADVYAIGLMAEYLDGPGFDGWMAWVTEQRALVVAGNCRGCGHGHELPEVDAFVVRQNLAWFMRPLKEARGTA